MKIGIQLIKEERQRQIAQENWTPAHDDQHDNQQLQRAAEAYLLSANMNTLGFKSFRPPNEWPWDEEDWKPSTPTRDLTKAGALWLAEIDRIKRLGSNHIFPSIMKNLENRVKECAYKIEQLISKNK
jgi:hypothetical protein